MQTENVTKTVRNLIGSIEIISYPKVLDHYDSSNPNAKPFFIRICGDVGKSSGSFMVGKVQCKIVNGKLVPDIKIHEDTKYFYNCSTPLKESCLIYIWSPKRKAWVDASTTTKNIERRSDDRIKWIKFSKLLEKKYGFSKTESRRCFRLFKLTGVEELLCWLSFFKTNEPSKDFVQEILDSKTSKEEISEAFNFNCKNVSIAKEAMIHYLKS